MSKSTAINSRGQSVLLPHRKVFMITEKCDEKDDQRSMTDATTARRKRKMILIMDENPQGNAAQALQRSNCIKHGKTENAVSNVGGTPKLLFFANSVDEQVTQKIEEILPEILSRIQWKNGRVIDDNENSSNILKQTRQNETQCDSRNRNFIDNSNAHTKERQQHVHPPTLPEDNSDSSNSEAMTTNLPITDYVSQHSNNSNLMLLGDAAAATVANNTTTTATTITTRRITLPPKKYHSKFQRQLNNSNNNNASNNIKHGDGKIISAATPVIVSATSLYKVNNEMSVNRTTIVDNSKHDISHTQPTPIKTPPLPTQQQQQQKINKIKQSNGNSQDQQHKHLEHHHHHQSQHQLSKQQQNTHQINKNRNNNNRNKSNNNNANNDNDNNDNEKTTKDEKESIVVQQQNINLTGDFLFLMKMLPMLEKTPEPRKSQVKSLIEKIVKQCTASVNQQ